MNERIVEKNEGWAWLRKPKVRFEDPGHTHFWSRAILSAMIADNPPFNLVRLSIS